MTLSKAATSLSEAATKISECVACSRLAAYVGGFRSEPGYWGRPVPGFGDAAARMLVLGLAPGAHGANRTGRPFTGDGAGVFLYRALHETGCATIPIATSIDDGLRLKDAFITNVAKCAPPENKPLPAEIARCATHFDRELRALRGVRVVLALGRTAHDAWVRREAKAAGLRARDVAFAHGAVHRFGAGRPALVDSFHPSRYNVNVGVLTYPMFLDAMRKARAIATAP